MVAVRKPRMGRACVYSRVSNPGDMRDASLDTQEAKTIAILRGMGYTVEAKDVFRERQSGKDTIRPVLTHIKDEMRAGTYVAIGFYCLDRLVRSQVHTAILFDEFDRLGVTPISATNDIGDGTPEGKLILAIRAYLAESERIKIEERTARGRREYRERGEFVKMGVTKFGYLWDQKKRVRIVQDDEMDIITDIFERSARGESNNSIARTYTALGTTSPSVARGKRGKVRSYWSAAMIGQIINDPAYKGWTVVGRYTTETLVNEVTGKKRKKVIRLPEERWAILDRDGVITQAIVSSELWAKANEMSHARRCNIAASHRFVGHRAGHLLRGIANCGVCGCKLYPHTNEINKDGNRNYRYYTYTCQSRNSVWRRGNPGVEQCSLGHIRADKLDPAVWSIFRDMLLTPGRLESACERMDNEPGEGDGITRELVSAKGLVAKREKDRDTIYQKWRKEVEAEDGDEDFAAKLEADYRAMKPAIDALRAEVKSLESRLAKSAKSPRAAANFRERFAGLRDRLAADDDTEFEERFELLRLAGARVVATKDSCDLYVDVFGEGDSEVAKPDGIGSHSIWFSNLALAGSIEVAVTT